ncbi:MAG: hypothetical protein K6G15_03880 [Desulfovibrio sp.]|nr:hypothetical protein [Desulfovibrio sp.]
MEINEMTANICEGIDAQGESLLENAVNLKSIVLDDCQDVDLAKICSLFPALEELEIHNGERMTSLAPLSALTQLKRLELTDCAISDLSALSNLTQLTELLIESAVQDLSWMKKLTKLSFVSLSSEALISLAGLPQLPTLSSIMLSGGQPKDLTPLVQSLPNLQKLDLRDMLLPDLAPLSKLGSLTELNLHGSKLQDFSALAACAHLVKLGYYGTDAADYTTLGTLRQVRELEGGMTKLRDLAWIAVLPDLKSFSTISEPIGDLSPLADSSLEKLVLCELGQNKEDIDLSPISRMPKLKELSLLRLEQVKGSSSLAGLVSLEKLEIDGYNTDSGTEQFDLAGAAQWQHLGQLILRDVDVLHFEALAGCQALTSVELKDMQGAGDLAALKKLPHLKTVELTGTFPEGAAQGFAPAVEVDQ